LAEISTDLVLLHLLEDSLAGVELIFLVVEIQLQLRVTAEELRIRENGSGNSCEKGESHDSRVESRTFSCGNAMNCSDQIIRQRRAILFTLLALSHSSLWTVTTRHGTTRRKQRSQSRETYHKDGVFGISSGEVAVDAVLVIHHPHSGDRNITDPVLEMIQHPTLLVLRLQDDLTRGVRGRGDNSLTDLESRDDSCEVTKALVHLKLGESALCLLRTKVVAGLKPTQCSCWITLRDRERQRDRQREREVSETI
jgi:hypothetical protein